jgi:hypothetical protein
MKKTKKDEMQYFVKANDAYAGLIFAIAITDKIISEEPSTEQIVYNNGKGDQTITVHSIQLDFYTYLQKSRDFIKKQYNGATFTLYSRKSSNGKVVKCEPKKSKIQPANHGASIAIGKALQRIKQSRSSNLPIAPTGFSL